MAVRSVCVAFVAEKYTLGALCPKCLGAAASLRALVVGVCLRWHQGQFWTSRHFKTNVRRGGRRLRAMRESSMRPTSRASLPGSVTLVNWIMTLRAALNP